jgi:hypothetical protein
MVDMRSFYPISTALAVILLLFSGCTAASPHDGPVKLALEAKLATDEFTQEERDAVNSIKVHNDKCWVWLKKDWAQDSETITATAQHIGSVFAEEFWSKGMDMGFKAPKYMVQVWMKIPGEKGYHDSELVDAWWDTQKAKVDMEKYGLAEFKGIK